MGDHGQERIIMTPKKKSPHSTTILMERRKLEVPAESSKLHVAGGDHAGIVINKEVANGDLEATPSQLSLEFKVFLVNANTNTHTQESRQLRFWFKKDFPEVEQAKSAQEFFKELVSPQEFPRDYVGFIKKIMKLMQHRYPFLKTVEVEMKQLEDSEKLPDRPLSMDESILKIELTEEKVLEMIESAYPTPLSVTDMARQTQSCEEEIGEYLSQLSTKGLIKAMDNCTYTRVVQNETEVQIVKQMPKIVRAKQPSIAIITAQYCEKMAVDAMIENKETFFRYTTVGESNVYTLGNIGSHRVVCTKLPTVGHTREAMIAAGNTTTRLLGTFQKVEYVFLVGVGGGVPHYTDYNKHVRLGDVVVSAPAPETRGSIYIYCDAAKHLEEGCFEFETKSWGPPNLVLQEISANLKAQGESETSKVTWHSYIEQGFEEMKEQDSEFKKPSQDTDKLYMSIGGKDVIEVAHPSPPTADGIVDVRKDGLPRVHMGPIASGRQVARDEQLRQAFAARYGTLAFDSEFDAVVESIFGNRKDSYVFIRGIADYKDGSRKKEWQPYAALAAASFMKAVICGMEPPADD